MKISGIRKEHVEFEVAESDILYSALKLVESSLKTHNCYVRDGVKFVYSYTHHHNGDDEYEAQGNATDEEIENYELFSKFYNFVRNFKGNKYK